MFTSDNILYTFCHHKPARLLDFFGGTSLLCGRCSGIYIGFAVGALLVLLLLRSKAPALTLRTLWPILIAALILPLEVAFEKITGINTGNEVRYATGLLMGGSLAIAVSAFWGVFFPEQDRFRTVSGKGDSLQVLAFAFLLGAALVFGLFYPPAFNFLVLAGLSASYVSVNILVARGILGISSFPLCIGASVLLTGMEWSALFVINNGILASRL